MVTDTHVHVASADTERYPLSPSGGAGSHWWRDPLTVERLLGEMDDAGVRRAVLVQSIGAYRYDCSYVLDAVQVSPLRLRAVAAVDLGAPSALADLVTLAGRPGVTGVRMLATGADAVARLEHPSTVELWEAAGVAGVTMVVVVLESGVAALEQLAETHPETTVVLDHCAMPTLSEGLLPLGHPVLGMARLPKVYLKVSTPVLTAAEAAGHPSRLLHQLVESYGPSRLMWGSDLPQTSDRDYSEMVGLLDEACDGLEPAARAGVRSGTADAVFFG